MEAVGLSSLLPQALLVLAIWFRLGWPSLIIAVIGLLVAQLEARGTRFYLELGPMKVKISSLNLLLSAIARTYFKRPL